MKQFALDDGAIDPLLEEYEREFEQLSARAVQGDIDRDGFEAELAALVTLFLLRSYKRGLQLEEDAELSVEEQAAYDEILEANQESVPLIAEDIYAGRYSANDEQTVDEGRDKLRNRNVLWVVSAAAAYSLGQTFRRDDPYYRWRLGPTERHCADCSRLDGQVHTASEWNASGWYPRAGHLECTGRRCACGFEETSGPSQGGF